MPLGFGCSGFLGWVWDGWMGLRLVGILISYVWPGVFYR